MSACRPDLLELGIDDAHARSRVDQHELTLQCRQARWPLGDDRRHQRADAEALNALALHPTSMMLPSMTWMPNRAVRDVLRRHDGAAEVKAGGAIEIADRRRQWSPDRPARPSCRKRPPGCGEILGAIACAPAMEILRSTNSGVGSAAVFDRERAAPQRRRLPSVDCSEYCCSKRRSSWRTSTPDWLACWASAASALANMPSTKANAAPVVPRRNRSKPVMNS